MRRNNFKLKPSSNTGKPTPAPEIIAPGDWKITEVPPEAGHMGFASRGHGEMVVPLGESPLDAAIRLHELAHIKWSPDEVPNIQGLNRMFILGNEDYRVNWLMRQNMAEFQERIRFDFQYGEEANYADTKAACLRKDYGGLAAVRIASSGLATAQEKDAAIIRCQQEGLIEPEIAGRITRAVDIARDILKSDPYNFDTTVRAAQAMQAIIDGIMTKKTAGNEFDAMVEDAADEMISSLDAEALAELLGAIDRKDTDAMDRAIKKMKSLPSDFGGTGSGGNRWGKLKIVHKPLSIRTHTRKISRKKRSDKMGSVPRSIHRWNTDQKIFSRRYREYGGAVLIDQSGSMGLTPEQVVAIIEVSPSVVVAGYSGISDYGTLQIHSAKNLTVKPHEMHLSGAGNIVDGPALHWLGKQMMPRIWVSDGYVTGIGDMPAPNLTREAAALCKKYHIIRVGNLNEAVALFKYLRG